MLKYVQIIRSLYYKNVIVDTDYSTSIFKNIPEKISEKITWNNTDKLSIFAGYTIFKRKKGLAIYLEINPIFPTVIKEWKQKDTQLKIITTYKEIKPTLQQLLNYYDSTIAMQYIKEHFVKEV